MQRHLDAQREGRLAPLALLSSSNLEYLHQGFCVALWGQAGALRNLGRFAEARSVAEACLEEVAKLPDRGVDELRAARRPLSEVAPP